VKTAGGGVEADNGAWRGVTLVAGPVFGKQAPAAGATLTGSAVTFTWTAVAGESYRVCWDPSPNQGCDATWVDAGSATTLTATGVAPGTYYWPLDFVDHGALGATLSEVTKAPESKGGR